MAVFGRRRDGGGVDAAVEECRTAWRWLRKLKRHFRGGGGSRRWRVGGMVEDGDGRVRGALAEKMVGKTNGTMIGHT